MGKLRIRNYPFSGTFIARQETGRNLKSFEQSLKISSPFIVLGGCVTLKEQGSTFKSA